MFDDRLVAGDNRHFQCATSHTDMILVPEPLQVIFWIIASALFHVCINNDFFCSYSMTSVYPLSHAENRTLLLLPKVEPYSHGAKENTELSAMVLSMIAIRLV